MDGFNALLRLVPRPRHERTSLTDLPQRRGGTGGGHMRVARRGPLGDLHEVWQEVPMVELPNLLRLMMGSGKEKSESEFLVDESEEILVFHCWSRHEDAGMGNSGNLGSVDALTHEQVLWLDVVAALAETAPCSEASVPATRVRLADEGLASRAELEEEVAAHRRGDVPAEDAPRLASLDFFRQYVQPHILKDEVLSRLLPSGSSGTVRVFSAELAEASAKSGAAVTAGKPPRPKTLDDLFSEDAAPISCPPQCTNVRS